MTKNECPMKKFWNEYIDANLLDRYEMIQNLPILKKLPESYGFIKEKCGVESANHSQATILNGLFEDLLEVSREYSRKENEKDKLRRATEEPEP